MDFLRQSNYELNQRNFILNKHNGFLVAKYNKGVTAELKLSPTDFAVPLDPAKRDSLFSRYRVENFIDSQAVQKEKHLLREDQTRRPGSNESVR